MTVLDGVDRVALARAALARAEERTGARSVRTAPGAGRTDSGTRRTAPGPGRTAPASAPGTLPASAGSSLAHPDRPPLPVPAELAGLLPEGALRRGTSLVVTGSTSLLLGLVARASQEGSWVAVVGLPAVGLLAAQQAGVVLDRLALVPRPGPDAATVLAALVDGVDVVVVGEDAVLVDADRRRVTARVRERGTVLLSTAPWPGAQVVLQAEPVEWTGLGAGHGHLHRHRVAVTRSGRGGAARGACTEVLLPVRAVGTAPLAPAAPAPTPARRQGAAPVPLRMVG